MATFAPVKLKSGEPRQDYIRRRLTEGADARTISDEINGPELYSGPEGKSWPLSTVYAEKRKITPALASAAPASPVAAEAAVAEIEVPPQYEGLLTPEDMAEIEKEAVESTRKDQRKKARAILLEDAKKKLAREAEIAQRQGAARGDMVDITIDLATYAPSIVLDSRVYYHGTTHRVARSVAKVLQEQMQRSWLHEASVHGRPDRNNPRGHRLSGAGTVPGVTA